MNNWNKMVDVIPVKNRQIVARITDGRYFLLRTPIRYFGADIVDWMYIEDFINRAMELLGVVNDWQNYPAFEWRKKILECVNKNGT